MAEEPAEPLAVGEAFGEEGPDEAVMQGRPEGVNSLAASAEERLRRSPQPGVGVGPRPVGESGLAQRDRQQSPGGRSAGQEANEGWAEEHVVHALGGEVFRHRDGEPSQAQDLRDGGPEVRAPLGGLGGQRHGFSRLVGILDFEPERSIGDAAGQEHAVQVHGGETVEPGAELLALDAARLEAHREEAVLARPQCADRQKDVRHVSRSRLCLCLVHRFALFSTEERETVILDAVVHDTNQPRLAAVRRTA